MMRTAMVLTIAAGGMSNWRLGLIVICVVCLAAYIVYTYGSCLWDIVYTCGSYLWDDTYDEDELDDLEEDDDLEEGDDGEEDDDV